MVSGESPPGHDLLGNRDSQEIFITKPSYINDSVTEPPAHAPLTGFRHPVKGLDTMNRLSFLLVLFIFAFQVSPSHGDTFTGTGSRWPAAQLKSIAADSDYVYAGDGDTLSIFRKTDFQRVAYLRFKNTTEGVRALAYYATGTKKIIYAACGYSGIQVVDVTDPLNPSQEHTGQLGPDMTRTGAFATSIHGTVANTTAYVRSYDIEIHNRYAFIADNTYGIRVLDLDTPLIPVEVGYINLASSKFYPLSIDVYATGPTSNVYAVVILNSPYGSLISRYLVGGFGSNPLSLTHMSWTLLQSISGSVTMNILGLDNDVTDRYAYCLDSYANDLMIYNVLHSTNPNDEIEPVFTQRNANNNASNALALFQPRSIDLRRIQNDADYAYVTTYYPARNQETGLVLNPGLKIIDMSNVTNPQPVEGGFYNIPGANSVKVDGDDVYVASQRNGIYNLKTDFSAENKVRLSATGKTPLNTADITVVNNEIVFLPDNRPGSDGGLTVLRVAPPSKIDDDDDEDRGDTRSVYIASPAFPVHETFLPTPGQAKAFSIKDSFYYGYIADGSQGIQFLDLRPGGLTAPVLVQGSNLPVAAPYEVVDVNVYGNTLVALTTDPNQELWAVDVSVGTSVAMPTDYSGNKMTGNLPGNASARKVVTYKGQEGTYALIASGTDGLIIVNLIPDTENPEVVLPPVPENLIQITGVLDARNVDADDKRTGIYAYVADGSHGVRVVRLYDPSNLADMAPEIVKTLDVSTYGNAIDVNYFNNHLYVLTDNPDHAVLLYNMTDVTQPKFMSSSSSYGEGHSLWATQITLPCAECTSGYSYIKGVFIADGPGGLSFKQVTDENSGIDDREWSDDSTSCFINDLHHGRQGTGLFPIFVFLAVCLAAVFFCAVIIRGTLPTKQEKGKPSLKH